MGQCAVQASTCLMKQELCRFSGHQGKEGKAAQLWREGAHLWSMFTQASRASSGLHLPHFLSLHSLHRPSNTSMVLSNPKSSARQRQSLRWLLRRMKRTQTCNPAVLWPAAEHLYIKNSWLLISIKSACQVMHVRCVPLIACTGPPDACMSSEILGRSSGHAWVLCSCASCLARTLRPNHNKSTHYLLPNWYYTKMHRCKEFYQDVLTYSLQQRLSHGPTPLQEHILLPCAHGPPELLWEHSALVERAQQPQLQLLSQGTLQRDRSLLSGPLT